MKQLSKILAQNDLSCSVARFFSIPSLVHANDNQWRCPDPENILVIDTNKGRMIIEMRPEMAPKAIERIKLVTRERFMTACNFIA